MPNPPKATGAVFALETFGIVCTHGPEGGRYYDGDDYVTLSIVKDFLRFGIEPRHLTMYKHFADRESAFFEALVAPTLRQKNPDARRTASRSASSTTPAATSLPAPRGGSSSAAGWRSRATPTARTRTASTGWSRPVTWA